MTSKELRPLARDIMRMADEIPEEEKVEFMVGLAQIVATAAYIVRKFHNESPNQDADRWKE